MSDSQNNTPPQVNESEIIKVRHEKLQRLREEGQDPFLQTKFDINSYSTDIIENFEKMEGSDVKIAGRLMSKRVMGKASFGHVQDTKGKIQIYVKRDLLGEEEYRSFKKMDIGDIVGVSGKVFKTQKGEISVEALEVTLLSKSLLPLPEKYHGLKDLDLRYRQRYVDLIVNPEVRDVFVTRSKIMKEIRNFMDDRGFLEVETPVLSNHSTNSAARPFRTHHNTLDIDMFLRVETELALKRLIVGGLDRVYEIGRIFRNEGMSPRHNPEFTSIEIYQAYTDLEGMMNLTEDMFIYLADTVLGKRETEYQGEMISFSSPFERLSMVEAVKKYSGVDFDSFELDDEKARSAAKGIEVHVDEDATWGEVLNDVFEAKVEENLVQPTFIYNYPIEVSPLAKKIEGKPHLTARFEIFVTRRELGNAFTELNDPIDQRERFEKQAIAKHGDEDYSIDEDFVTAMEYGMPPTGGLGIGLDRLIMLYTDSASIRDVLLFPTMKPKE
ncbi:MAG: lysine--tRNA ligase [Eubacteriales bacterium]